MKQLSIFLCLILAFASCEKEDETVMFKGSVLSSSSADNVTDAIVILEHKPVTSSLYTAGYKKLASARTTGNGSFEMEFSKSRSSDYRVRVRKDGYFTRTKEYKPEVFESGKSVNQSYEIIPKGYVKVHLKNTTRFNDDDHLLFFFPDMENLGAGCCTGGFIHGHGRWFDSSFVCAAAGGAYLSYEYNYTMDNTTLHFGPDSLFLPAFDTTSLNVHY